MKFLNWLRAIPSRVYPKLVVWEPILWVVVGAFLGLIGLVGPGTYPVLRVICVSAGTVTFLYGFFLIEETLK